MQKWEYLELSVVGYISGGPRFVQSINGQDQGQNRPDFFQYIAQLGEAGWELVSHYGEGVSQDQSWAFKRPKP